jgi:GH35 family endo-1,4-beta-xylanase
VWPEFRRAPKSIERLRSDQEGLSSAIREHIKFMVNRFNYPVTEWDVLNEAVNHDEYMRILGKDVVKEWFQLVKDMNPNVKRYINDYSILTKNNVRHRKRYFRYIKGLLDSGVPIDGIGFQSHIPKGFNPTPPEEIIRIANDFSSLGPELQVTEFDFETSNRDLQAQYTEDFMTAIFSQPKMTGLITWTPFEYAKNNVPKPEAALIDKDLQFKPNGMVWYELINKRWMTKTIVSTDDNGYLKFRGFKGRYLASISHSKKEVLDIDLSESNELVITLT